MIKFKYVILDTQTGTIMKLGNSFHEMNTFLQIYNDSKISNYILFSYNELLEFSKEFVIENEKHIEFFWNYLFETTGLLMKIYIFFKSKNIFGLKEIYKSIYLSHDNLKELGPLNFKESTIN